MAKDSLISRLYRERALSEAARIIGYGGVEPFAFWDQAKALKIEVDGKTVPFIGDERPSRTKQEVLMAVYDLTRADRREASPPRYELTAPVRKACFGLLGPPPEHESHDFIKHGPPNILDEAGARRWQDDYRRRKQAEADQPAEGEAAAEAGKKPRRKGKAR
jgi:hypothetical protein